MGLTKLSHGKMLTQQNYPDFVDTFNAMVDFIQNLRGDWDNNGTTGHIQVDKACITGPVIRYMDQSASQQGSSGEEHTLSAVTGVKWNASTGTINITTQEFTFTGTLSALPTQTTIGTDPWTGAPTPFPNVN